MAINTEFYRDWLIRDIVFNNLEDTPFEGFIQNYACEVLSSAQTIVKRILTDNEKYVITTRLRHYCLPILKEVFVQTTFCLFKQALSEFNPKQLVNIFKFYHQRKTGIIQVRIEPNAKMLSIFSEIFMLNSGLLRIHEQLNQNQDVVKLHMQQKMDTIASTSDALYAIDISEILGVKGMTFKSEDDPEK